MPLVPWSAIDTVLLDMDGTLLDLHFDNHFWLEHLPLRYAQRRGIDLEQARADLHARFARHAGTLNWYCLAFWSAELDLPILELKREVAGRVALRPGAGRFLAQLRGSGRRVALVTNAHRGSLDLKLERIALAPYFDRLISAHDYGFPKEDQGFWQALRTDFGFDPARSLFIDDSLPVLRSAQRYGIRQLLAVSRPDLRQAPRQVGEFRALDDFDRLLPIPAGSERAFERP
jgi:putative hydrolase of the HAD superfamily